MSRGAARPRAAPVAGVSVVRLLLAAAVLGVAGGVVLATMRQPQGDPLARGAKLADDLLPLAEQARPDVMVPDPVSLRGLPAYPGAMPRRIMGAKPGTKVNAISWFNTPDSIDKVLSFYDEAYRRQRLFHVKHRWPKSGYVSWFEQFPNPDGGNSEFGAGILHMVSAFSDGYQTTVMLSATDPMGILEGLSPLPPGVWVPPGPRPQVINVGEVGRARYSIFASYPQLPAVQLADSIEQHEREAGWQLEERLTAPDTGRISVVLKHDRMTQMAVVEGTGEKSQVLITLEER